MPRRDAVVRIVSHNAFWFQAAPYLGVEPGPPDDAVLWRLADLYTALAPDVLCVQEVQDERTFKALRAAMDMDGRYCPGGELPQYGGAILWRRGPGGSSGPPEYADWRGKARAAPGNRSMPVPQRMWQVLRTSWAGGLCVANVHLPSARQLTAPEAKRRRLAELTRVLGRDPRPNVIAGDLNEQPGGPVGELLQSCGYRDAAVVAGQADLPTNVGGGRGDYIWLSNDVDASLLDYSATAEGGFAAGRPGKQYLSDHLPLRVSLGSGRDR